MKPPSGLNCFCRKRSKNVGSRGASSSRLIGNGSLVSLRLLFIHSRGVPITSTAYSMDTSTRRILQKVPRIYRRSNFSFWRVDPTRRKA